GRKAGQRHDAGGQNQVIFTHENISALRTKNLILQFPCKGIMNGSPLICIKVPVLRRCNCNTV
ncbi:MAG: hypothetical protein KA777_09810, partial [Rhodoferax sp.]|nr:hypothetical protein [Rhodoferax sp.]